MYENDSKNNIDLVECMERGKVVLILMNEEDFNTTQVKNIINILYKQDMGSKSDERSTSR